MNDDPRTLDFPARPFQELDACGMPRSSGEYGLNARDEFAMAALSSTIQMFSRHSEGGFLNAAIEAYRYADSMLIARTLEPIERIPEKGAQSS